MKAGMTIIMLVLTALAVLLGQEAGTNMGQTAFAGVGGPADLSAMPPGSVVVYAGSIPPDGWLLCDGALYDITAAPELFKVIEFTYGSDALKKAFRVPDLQTRVPVGMKPFTYYCDALGKTGGEAEVSLSESEMPSHKHNVSASSHTHAITTSPHTHMIAESAHTHVATASPHGHAINDPGHNHGIHDPGHDHRYVDRFGGDDAAWGYADMAGGGLTTYARDTFEERTGIVINAHATGITVQNTTVPVSVADTKATASAQNATVNATAGSASTSVSEESRGGGQSHQNMQPYLVMNYIIKY